MINYFANNLRYLRKIHGFTQAELAEKLMLRRATISTYERGCNSPTIDTLLKLRKLFNISIDDVLTKKINVKFIYQNED